MKILWNIYVKLNDRYRIIRRKLLRIPAVTLTVDDMSQGNQL